MANDPNQQAAQGTPSPDDPAAIEQARRQVNQIAEEIAQLSESKMEPTQYFSEFLQRVYFAMQGFAAAIWVRTPQGNLQLQCQINLREVALDRTPDSKPMHDELLRQAALQAKGGVVTPHFSHNFGTTGDQIAGNPTDYVILLVPIMQEKQVIGLVEVWQDPSRAGHVVQSLYQFLVRMSAFVSLFQRNHQLRQMLGQQDLWLKLETFSRQIHGSLNTTEVAYLIANESRRLIEVDRVSVATRTGRKCAVTAISGADVVEKRSNLVQLMRALFDAVIEWGERLVYTGTKDDALPPRVVSALDAYLGESNSKILVVMPLADEREKDRKMLARSALMMESFETTLLPEQLLARLDVVGRHATSALYNAQEYRRIPMRFLWLPLAYVQDGLGGKAKAITTAALTGVAVLILALIFVPFPLKMESNGQALPIVRQWIYSPLPGKVEEIPLGLRSGKKVNKGQPLFVMFDFDLSKQVGDLNTEIEVLKKKSIPQAARGPGEMGENRSLDNAAVEEAKITHGEKIKMLQRLIERTNADRNRPGFYTIVAPRTGIILSADFRENLIGKNVKPGEPLIRIGFTDPDNAKLADWEIELKIPQKHVGQVLRAFDRLGVKELDVNVMFVANSTTSYRAKLHRNRIAAQANVQKDDNNETEAVVLAYARISGEGIPADEQVPPMLLLAGNEVHTRIRCGNRPMGYSLFYGVWEFLYEKVIFPYYWR